MRSAPIYYVAPFQRRRGKLNAADLIECPDEDSAFKRGKSIMGHTDGLVFFKIETSEDGDVWSRVELLATVGDVPKEAV